MCAVAGYVPPTPGPLPDAGGNNYAVVFEGSLRNAGVAHAQFSLPPDAPVTAIIKYLHDQGFTITSPGALATMES